jgi:hypothetical protein
MNLVWQWRPRWWTVAELDNYEIMINDSDKQHVPSSSSYLSPIYQKKWNEFSNIIV